MDRIGCCVMCDGILRGPWQGISTGTWAQGLALQKTDLLTYYDDVLDGKYGYKTYLAVKKFQESVGIQADGIAGPKTLEKLGYMAPVPSTELYKLGDAVAKIAQIQDRLIALGYLTGSETGVFDLEMQKAVLAFQKTNALPENGMVDGTMLMAMNAATAFGKSIENWKLGLSVLRLMVHDFYDSVANVQDLLFKLDYVDKTDGYYNEATQDAVKLFQQKNGLPVDGMVGPATYNMLTNPAARKKSDPTPPGDSGAGIKLLYGKSEGTQVVTLQNALTGLNYYSGPINASSTMPLPGGEGSSSTTAEGGRCGGPQDLGCVDQARGHPQALSH